MARSQSPEERAEAKARREAERKTREAVEEVEVEAGRQQRRDQLELVTRSAAQLGAVSRDLRSREKKRADLDHHLAGLYEEIDKLAKGKSLLSVSDLVLEETNAIVKQAKDMIRDDVHLDRVKEFVAAGDNPVYPDVLVVLRAIRQAVHRYGEQLERAQRHVSSRLREAQTFVPALQVLLADEEPLTKHAVQQVAGSMVSLDEGWFVRSFSGSPYSFDLAEFDRLDLGAYLSPAIDNLDTDDEDD